LLDIGRHMCYLQGLFCMYHESYKGRITHSLYGGLSLSGDLIDCIVKPTRALITDYDTSNIFKGFSGPSWARLPTLVREAPFQPLYLVCVHWPFCFTLVCSLIISWP
jgi:hypothetical protein